MAETGILTKMYQQAGDQISYTADRQEYVQTWKGPWSEIMNLYTTHPSVCGTWISIGGLFMPSENWISSYPLDDAFNWVIQSYNVEEIEAGDHGILRMTLVPRRKTDTYYTTNEEWSMGWGVWQPTALAYCTDGRLSGNLSGDNTYSVNVQHAVNYYRAENQTNVLSTWSENGETYNLNKGEYQIAQFYSRDVQPLLSYPIITFRKTYHGLSATEDAQVPDWGLSVNVISANFTLPTDQANWIKPGKPSFLPDANWKFILRDFNVTYAQGTPLKTNDGEVKVFDVGYSARWEGCVNAEDRFYSPDGSKRWKIGRVKADGTNAN